MGEAVRDRIRSLGVVVVGAVILVTGTLVGVVAGPAVASAPRPHQSASTGYTLVGSDGGVFSFSGARFHGSTGRYGPQCAHRRHRADSGRPGLLDGGLRRRACSPSATPRSTARWAGPISTAPIVGMASSNDGRGYWLVASDGGIFAFGDAGFYGSTGGTHLNAPVVGMAPNPDGNGYWLVASDGGVFSFGFSYINATFYGSMGGKHARPARSWAWPRPPTAIGYWLVAADGGVFTFGDAPFLGSAAGRSLGRPMVGMASTTDGHGYWLVAADGGVFPFGDAPFAGSLRRHPPRTVRSWACRCPGRPPDRCWPQGSRRSTRCPPSCRPVRPVPS